MVLANLNFNQLNKITNQSIDSIGGITLISIDDTRRYLIKIIFKQCLQKRLTIFEEFAVIKKLNEAGCIYCPTAYCIGELTFKELREGNLIPERMAEIFAMNPISSSDKFKYMIQDFVKGNYAENVRDCLPAIFNQKKHGVYQGDIKQCHTRIDPKTGICKLIDYDQAIYLDPAVTTLSDDEFLMYQFNQKENLSFGKLSYRAALRDRIHRLEPHTLQSPQKQQGVLMEKVC